MLTPTKSQNGTNCGSGDSNQSYFNPFLRVFAISAFLKVIHAPKTPKPQNPKTPKVRFLQYLLIVLKKTKNKLREIKVLI